jgi:hypothetical protein
MQLKKGYRFWRGAVRLFTRPIRTEWAVPYPGGPSVFIANHAGALGPIYMCARFPLADILHPWMNAQVLSAREVPAYVRQDYWWPPESKLAPLYNATLPYIAAAVMPPILRTAPTVPVYHDMRVVRTLRESLRVLKEGEPLLIFPEQPSGFKSHESGLNSGFLQVAATYTKITNQPLAFWPVRIEAKARVFQVGAPLYYLPDRTLAEQTAPLLNALAAAIHPADPA